MTSRLFDPRKVLPIFGTKQKAKDDRTMFYAFPEYVRSHITHDKATTPSVSAAQKEALLYFSKNDEFDAIVHEKQLARRTKEIFSGHIVMEWTEVPYWGVIKKIMDEVRSRIGGEDWREIMVGMSQDQIKSLTIEVKEVILREEELRKDEMKVDVDSAT